MFRQECEQFDKMGIHEKFIYILTYEGPLLSRGQICAWNYISKKGCICVTYVLKDVV